MRNSKFSGLTILEFNVQYWNSDVETFWNFGISNFVTGYDDLLYLLTKKDDKTSFIIVELCAALFDFIDNSEDILESDQSHQFCDTINRHLSCENPPELTSVKSCAKICSILWTNACHVDSFEQISRHYLAENHRQEGQEVILDVIKKCLKYFLTLHSNALLSSSEVLNSPIINEIVQLLATVW